MIKLISGEWYGHLTIGIVSDDMVPSFGHIHGPEDLGISNRILLKIARKHGAEVTKQVYSYKGGFTAYAIVWTYDKKEMLEACIVELQPLVQEEVYED